MPSRIEDKSDRDLLIRILTHTEEISEKLQHLDDIVTGNGDPTNGHIVRIDRLEQAHKSHRWWMNIVGGTSISAAVLWVFEFVRKH